MLTEDEFNELKAKGWEIKREGVESPYWHIKSPRIKRDWSFYALGYGNKQRLLNFELDCFLAECKESIDAQFTYSREHLLNQIRLLADRNMPVPNPIEITFKVNF